MESTMLPNHAAEEGFIAGSVLQALSNNYGERRLLGRGVSTDLNTADIFYIQNNEYKNISTQPTSRYFHDFMAYLHLTELTLMERVQNDSTTYIINKLLEIPNTEKIISQTGHKEIKIWVITNKTDIKTKRIYCDAFAELVEEKLDLDYSFDLRIVGGDSFELGSIPSKAIMTVRK